MADLELEMEIGKVSDMATVVGIVLEAYDDQVQETREFEVSVEMAAKNLEPTLSAVLFSFFHLKGMISDLQEQYLQPRPTSVEEQPDVDIRTTARR